jgi:hypothetical protein
VTKRYVHTLGRRRLLAAHQALLAAGVPSPFGEGGVEDAATCRSGPTTTR